MKSHSIHFYILQFCATGLYLSHWIYRRHMWIRYRCMFFSCLPMLPITALHRQPSSSWWVHLHVRKFPSQLLAHCHCNF